MARPKIGIFGGTFNPVHIGHLRLALEVREQAGLDKVEFLPVSIPPHKSTRGVLPFDFRVEVLRRAIEGVCGLGINELEASLPSPSFTCNTVEALSHRQENTDLYFLLGSDDLLDIINWEEGHELPQKMSFIIVERTAPLARVANFVQKTWTTGMLEDNRFIFPGGTEMLFLSVPCLEISSTLIRNKWISGCRIDFLVPGAVQSFLFESKKEVERFWASKQEQ